MFRGGALGAVVLLGGLAACDATLADHDAIYSRGADHFVLCSQNIDDSYQLSTEEIADALARAKRDGTTLHLYTHSPGDTIAIDALEAVLAAASELGVVFTTYEELSAHEVPGSLALAFDDGDLPTWTAVRPVLARYGVQLTLFVTRFPSESDGERAQLRQLADDGHDVEFHGVAHLDAVDYVAAHGADAYVADEIIPGLDAMRAAGYAPTVFAYPGGVRNDATDAALAPYFAHLRAIRSTCPRR